MEYWRCGKVDQRKRRDRPRSEIEGREILPGMERAVQQLCPMEQSCDRFKEQEVPVPIPRARVTTPRRAAIEAAKNIKDIAEREKEMI